jgi:hypothetical protein
MVNIIKINRLFAEFMGYNVIPYQHNEYKPIYNGNKYAKTVGQQKELWGGLQLEFTGRFIENVKYPFTTDFNYLLPIIRRIEENGYVVNICGIKYQIYKVLDENNPIISLVCGDVSKKTEMVCALLTEFIELENKMTN